MIFYLISSISKSNFGLGGHYYSLMHIAEAVSQKEEVTIINIGVKQASVLKAWNGPLYFIKTSFLEVSSSINELIQLCKKHQPDVIHAFDKTAGYYARIASMVCEKPWVLTKCGGPTPTQRKHFLSPSLYYPQAMTQTVFHKDDYNWFKNRRKKPLKLELITARVNVIFSKRNEFEELLGYYGNAEIKVVRIARISPLHYLSILQSIFFTKKMCECGVNAKLAIIGTIDSTEIYSKLNAIIGNETKFFMSKNFTIKASDFLPLADVAIGSGRSFMEGCAAGCMMMAPVNNSIYPALVTLDNLDVFEANNFSERTMSDEKINPDRDVNKYINEIKANKKQISKSLLDSFKKRYDVKNAVDKYIALYEQVSMENRYQKRICLDRIFHGFWIKYVLAKYLIR